MTIDINWFQRRIRDLGLSQRKLSVEFSNHPNTLSFILNGKRKLQTEEVPVLAHLLDSSPEEVMTRLGIELPAGSHGKVQVLGMVDVTGAVTKSATRSVEPPAHPNPKALGALIYNTANSAGGWMHGWVLYFEQAGGKASGVGIDALDRLCVLTLADKPNSLHVGIVRRALDRGRYDIVNAQTGNLLVGSVLVASARPVVWIKTA